eukprot:6206727-Pleurochrysis_carterae.AAC.2
MYGDRFSHQVSTGTSEKSITIWISLDIWIFISYSMVNLTVCMPDSVGSDNMDSRLSIGYQVNSLPFGMITQESRVGRLRDVSKIHTVSHSSSSHRARVCASSVIFARFARSTRASCPLCPQRRRRLAPRGPRHALAAAPGSRTRRARLQSHN